MEDDYQEPIDPQEVEERQLLRRGLVIGGAVLVLLGVAAWNARPALALAKGWRARQLAAEAALSLKAENWEAAGSQVQAAYHLKPNEPAAMRVLAQYLSATGKPTDALSLWKALVEMPAPTLADREEFAENLLRVGGRAEAEKVIPALLQDEPNSPVVWRLAARLDGAKGNFPGAIARARKALELEPAKPEGKLILATLLVQGGGAAGVAEGRQLIWELTADPGPIALQAIGLLAEGDKSLTAAQQDQLAQALWTHPAALEPHRMLAWELTLRAHPGQRDALVTQVLTEYQPKDVGTRRLAAVWLNTQGEPARVLRLLPLEEAKTRKDLILVYLDSLAALKRWNEILRILRSPQVPLEQFYVNIFASRCALEGGDVEACDKLLRKARTAAERDPEQIAFLAQYAERMGRDEPAESAYRLLASKPNTARLGFSGLLRLVEKRHDTAEMRALLQEMAVAFPNDGAVKNDFAYLDLLLSGDADAGLALAEELVKNAPSSLPHRTTLALAYLREDDPPAALRVYEGLEIPWEHAPANAAAVHAAALGLAGREEEARAQVAKIDLKSLRPEEKLLIDRWR